MRKILHFSNMDYGGSGLATYRLHCSLIKAGYNSKVIVLNKKKNYRNFIEFGPNYNKQILNRALTIFGFFKKRYSYYGNWKSYVETADQINPALPFSPDVIVLHWMPGFVDLEVISQLQQKYNAKIFWYLVDMGPMTGGCHFAWDCDGYQNSCNNCPATAWPFISLAKSILKRKKSILKKLDIELLSCTSWLSKQLSLSSIFKKNKIHELMIGIDESVYKPISLNNRKKIKKSYNIDKNSRIILFGALRAQEERKGLLYLIKALEILSKDIGFDKDNLILVSAGEKVNKKFFSKISIHYKYIGHLSGDSELVRAYQMADIFVSPSIEDSGPMMINESIMCGTPVVSFNMGVASDLVITNETGYLAKLRDAHDLANGIRELLTLSDKNYQLMKKNCRQVGMEKTSENSQISKLINIFGN